MFRFNTIKYKLLKNSTKPKYFFIGVLIGFIGCVSMGHIVSKYARLQHFQRFYLAIQPESQYYPTAHELIITARHEVSPNQILVLIGGNSLLRGCGQHASVLWSAELQRLLGSKYKVLNYAANGADMTDYGGVVFRTLQKEHPKIIFVSTCFPEIPTIEGTHFYNYFFWDSYFKGLMPLEQRELALVNKLKKEKWQNKEMQEQLLLSYLDSLLYFRNLWNFIGYNYAFTIWTSFFDKPYYPRAYLEDNGDAQPRKDIIAVPTGSPEFKQEIGYISTKISRYVYRKNNELHFSEEMQSLILQNYDTLFCPASRSKILGIVSSHNPRYLAALPQEQQDENRFLVYKEKEILESLGYFALNVGLDFVSEDFIDARHFSASGGVKIAHAVAQKVKEIAQFNGYIQ